MKVNINGQEFFRVTGRYAERDYLHPTGHSGIDLALPEGTPIHSPIDGEVIAVRDLGDANAGRYVKIRDENGETDLIFGHLSEFKVKVGEHVDKGDLIALSGNTGRSTGPHLHFGAKDSATGEVIDPGHWVDIFQEISEQILGLILFII